MPLYEYGCMGCGHVSEVLVQPGQPPPEAVACRACGSEETVRLVSRVNFRMYRKPKYSEAFLDKALPFLKAQKETAPYFAEGPKASDEAKAFEISERIGERIDRMLDRHFRQMQR
ncbi:MAG: hypothetical protein KatS3mg131_3463 [Candidatus Tectimicrobiota bacterium]|nr:MAG: hypothetical protein KatS3mg131_3463 [Candidatus Tectomicrobia bacterium]